MASKASSLVRPSWLARRQPEVEILDPAEPTTDAERRQRVERMRALARLLDEAFQLPGLKYRVGIDGLIGLIPGVGDSLSTLLSAYIIYEASKLGIPRSTVMRMVGNLALDAVGGAIPLLGDLFDVAFKANKKNMALVEKHLEKEFPRLHRPGR